MSEGTKDDEPRVDDASLDEGDVTATMPDMPAAKRRSIASDPPNNAEGGASEGGASEGGAESAGVEENERKLDASVEKPEKSEGDAQSAQKPDESEGDAQSAKKHDGSEGDGESKKKPAARSSGETSEASMGPIAYRFFGVIDVGLVREHNEDNFMTIDLSNGEGTCWGGEDDPRSGERLVSGEVGPKGLILAVCDGMGGAAAGEVASKMAVDTVREVMAEGETPRDRDDFARRLVYAVEEAGARIFGAAKMDRSRRGMGTTATVAGLLDHVLFVGQVGDSRCYVLRNGALALVTKDQSLVNQLIEAGQLTEEEAESFEHSNIILQALGTTEEVSVDLTFLELREGDRLLLCSDGLSGLVHQDMIREVLGDGDDLEVIARRLSEMANAGGGHDNITCVVAEVRGGGLAPAEDAPPVRYQQYPLPAGGVRSSEIPPREPSMKTSSRKPGADVKREPIDHDEGGPNVPSTGFPWGIVLALLALAALVIGLVVSRGTESGAATSAGAPASTGAPTSTGATLPPEPEPELVAVCVRSDVPDGELFVDGQGHGAIPEGGTRCVELPPGAYRFEARAGDSVAASASLTVRAGVPSDVELRLPRGTVRAVDGGAPDAGPLGAGPLGAGPLGAGPLGAGREETSTTDETNSAEATTLSMTPAMAERLTAEATRSDARTATMATATITTDMSSRTSSSSTAAETTMADTSSPSAPTTTTSTPPPTEAPAGTTTTTMSRPTVMTPTGATSTMTSAGPAPSTTTTAMTDEVPANPF